MCWISFTSESWGIKANTAGATLVSVAGSLGLGHWNHGDTFETPPLGCLDRSVGHQLGLELGCLFEIKWSAFIKYIEIGVSRFCSLALYNETVFLSFCTKSCSKIKQSVFYKYVHVFNFNSKCSFTKFRDHVHQVKGCIFYKMCYCL